MTMPPRSQPLPLDDQLCFAIYGAALAVGRAYKPLLDGLGITYPQYLVLAALWEENGLAVGAIAERLMLDSSTITPLLKRLEAAGFLTRGRNPDNERQVIVRLTPAGQEMRARCTCLGERLTEAARLSPADLARLTAQVRALRDAVSAHGVA